MSCVRWDSYRRIAEYNALVDHQTMFNATRAAYYAKHPQPLQREMRLRALCIEFGRTFKDTDTVEFYFDSAYGGAVGDLTAPGEHERTGIAQVSADEEAGLPPHIVAANRRHKERVEAMREKERLKGQPPTEPERVQPEGVDIGIVDLTGDSGVI